MMRLTVNGRPLDLLPDTSITIERHSPAYLGQDVDVFRGDFSYPFAIPLTANNMDVLEHPQRLDRSKAIGRRMPAELKVAGGSIRGYLYIEEPTATIVNVFLVGNPLLDLKELRLNELSLGTYDMGVDNAARLAHAEDTISLYDNYDHVFFPVLNKEAYATPTAAEFQNHWDITLQEFTNDGYFTPFIKVKPVLDAVLNATGLVGVDAFILDKSEMERLVIINNRNLKTEGGDIYQNIVYTNLVSDMKASDFLRHLSRLFCLAPFPNYSDNTLTLRPLKGLITAATMYDWTQYAADNYSYTQGQIAVLRHEYAAGAYTGIPITPGITGVWQPGLAQGDYAVEEANSGTLSGEDFGNYYTYSTGALVAYGQWDLGSGLTSDVLFTGYHFGAIDYEEGKETNSVELFPICSRQLVYDSNTWLFPMWSVGMAEVSDNVAMRLALFRGLQDTYDGNSYPLGNYNNYGYDTGDFYYKLPAYNYSLAWEGPYGLYEQWWKEWDEMLRNGKLVKRLFKLSPAQLFTFDFKNKVFVQNKDYFIRSMRFTINQNGVSPAEVEMISVF